MSEGSQGRTILRQVIETIGAQGSQKLVSFLGVILYVRLVSSNALGQYFLFVSVVNVAAFLGVIGINTHVEREIGRDSNNGTLLATTVAILAGFVGVFSVVTLIAKPFVTDYFTVGAVPLLIAGVGLRSATNLYGAVLRGQKKAPIAQTLASLERFLMFGFGVLLVASITQLAAFRTLGIAYIGSMGIHLILTLWFASVYPTSVPTLSAVQSLLEKTKFISVSQVYSQGQQWVDTLLIGYFLGPAPVAIYEVAWRVSGTSALVFNTLHNVLFPRLSEWVSQEKPSELTRYAADLYYYSLLPVYALLTGGAVTGDALLSLIYGTSYAAGWLPLVVLLFGRLFYTIERASSTLLFALDRERAVARISVVGLAVNLGLNSLLIPTFGIIGAAIATSTAFLVGGSLKRLVVGRHISIDPLWHANGIAAVGAVVMSIVLLLSRRYLFEISGLLELGLFVAGGAVLYSSTLTAVDPRFRRRVLALPGRL